MIVPVSPWWTAVLTWGAAAGYAALAAGAARAGRSVTRALTVGTLLLHALALLAAFTEQPVRFGFALMLSVTAWLVLAVYAVETRLYPQLATRWTLAGLGAPAVLLTLLFPGSAYPGLPSPWLPLHWALGFASYGLLGVAVAHGWMMQRTEASLRRGAATPAGLPLLALERLTFRFVAAAFVLLTLTLLAGWVLTALLHPTAGWITHKTVFTALSWAVLGALLWGRWRWGWRGRLAVRMLYAAGVLLLLAYVGSHFVLEVILRRGV
ncbi:cytochrome C assembly family protein [Tepidimonas charontis]|uniref:Inner membrane protein YpjD n=1 Tax=Tepidimonas charontis TaxID=2267262 RepID=A0A554XDF9_9BURK|nr:cytochrome c biogenesis protein CcsA [Tepidimonas charontis]TSE33868.1 Inner membrane protein YpjD [Tepidimonas charontis]